jgi:Ca-activated chloride channel family protein
MHRRIVHRTLWRSVGTLLIVVASSLEGVADQRPTFKSEAELVAVNVVVTDKQGRTLTNLTEGAFQVSEDSRPQGITQFTKDPLPLSIAVALDTSSSMRLGDRFRYARQAVWRLIDRLDPQDEIAIYGFNNWPYPITSWTSSRSAVVMALSDEQPMAAGGFTALFDAVRVGLNLLDTAAARRRALLIISDGTEELPGDHWLPGGMSGRTFWPRVNLSARDRLPKLLEDVRRSDDAVYIVAIDPSVFGPDEETLKALVDPTGGFVTTVHANSDIPRAVERVLNDLRDQYLIGFTPTHPADGTFHKLQVTVRGCDCHARARAGFVHSR